MLWVTYFICVLFLISSYPLRLLPPPPHPCLRSLHKAPPAASLLRRRDKKDQYHSHSRRGRKVNGLRLQGYAAAWEYCTATLPSPLSLHLSFTFPHFLPFFPSLILSFCFSLPSFFSITPPASDPPSCSFFTLPFPTLFFPSFYFPFPTPSSFSLFACSHPLSLLPFSPPTVCCDLTFPHFCSPFHTVDFTGYALFLFPFLSPPSFNFHQKFSRLFYHPFLLFPTLLRPPIPFYASTSACFLFLPSFSFSTSCC